MTATQYIKEERKDIISYFLNKEIPADLRRIVWLVFSDDLPSSELKCACHEIFCGWVYSSFNFQVLSRFLSDKYFFFTTRFFLTVVELCKSINAAWWLTRELLTWLLYIMAFSICHRFCSKQALNINILFKTVALTKQRTFGIIFGKLLVPQIRHVDCPAHLY